MELVLEGILFGLLLAASLGPIFVALTQTSIEKGTIPGLAVGGGVWISDILVISLFYKFISLIRDTVESYTFTLWLGLSGGIVLIAFGISLMLKKPQLRYTKKKFSKTSYLGFLLKGFLVNTINPFTFVFWLGVISTYVIGRKISGTETLILLATIMSIIIISDCGKVFLAAFLRRWLTPKHINWVTNFSGIVLIGFGLFLAVRVI